MKKVRINELNEAVQSFISDAVKGDGVMVEDEAGRVQCGVIPYRQATAEEIQRADASLARIRKKVGRAMREEGLTEEDVDRVLLEDD